MKKMARRLLACAVTVAILVACAISGLVLPAAAAEGPTNLFTNGDCESGWPFTWTAATDTVFAADGVGYNGSKGVKVTAGSVNADGYYATYLGVFSPEMSVEANKTYVLRFLVKGGASRVSVGANAALGNAVECAVFTGASDEWVQQSVFFKPTADGKNRFGFSLYRSDADVFYDNFEFYEVTAGTPINGASTADVLPGSKYTGFDDGNDPLVFNQYNSIHPCDGKLFSAWTNDNKTVTVEKEPGNPDNSVWHFSAATKSYVMPVEWQSYSYPKDRVLKLSFRYKGINGEVPQVATSEVWGAQYSVKVAEHTSGITQDGWSTYSAWYIVNNGNPTGTIQMKLASTNGMYVDDLKLVETYQAVTTPTDKTTVSSVTGIKFAESHKLLATGQTISQLPQGEVGDNVWDDNAYCGTLTWNSSDKTVATVDANGLVKMVGSENGKTATITATSSVDGAPSASYIVEMTVVEPTAIQMNKTQVTLLGAGATDTLSVVGTAPANSTAIPEKITWTSSDNTVATVDANGKVTAVYSGDAVKTATITAAYEGIETPATATVTVNNNLLPDDVFASVTTVDGKVTKHENGGYHNKPYITLAVPEEGATTSHTFTVNLQRPMKKGKQYVMSAIMKGSLCGVSAAGTSIRWNDTKTTAGDYWTEVRNIVNGVFTASSDATSLTISFINAPHGYSLWGMTETNNEYKDIVASFCDLKLYEFTDEINLLSGGAGDLAGETQKNFSTVTKKDGDDEWLYVNSTIQYTSNVWNTPDYDTKIYQYSVKYKSADASNGKFVSYYEENPNKYGHVVTSQVSGPDADGWYTFTSWVELLPASPNFTYAAFRATAPIYTKDWSCYLVPKAEAPFYGVNKLLTIGSQTNLSSVTWLGASNENAQWTIADESVVSFTAGSGPITSTSVTIKAKALGTTTVTVKDATSNAAPVTILVKVLPNTAGEYTVNFDTPNADIALKDINGNALSSLITGSIISVQVNSNSGYIPTPGTLRYVTADGTERRLLNRTELEGTDNSFKMQVPEEAFTLKIDMHSTAQDSFTAGTIGTAYRELDGQQQGDKVDGIRFLTRMYFEGLDLNGDKIIVRYNGTGYEVESMGTLLKRASNTAALTLDNVGGSGATAVWQVENYSNTANKLSVSAYSGNSLDFAATMTTTNPSETFKDRKYTSRGYIKLEGVDEIIYTTPRTDSAADAQKRATGEMVTSDAKYGVKWSTTDPDDLGARCFDAEGLEAVIGIGSTAGRSDFDTIYPWSGMVRCNVKEGANGEDIVTLEGEPGFALDGSNGNVFVRIPKFSVQKYTEDGYEYRVITGDDTQLHPAFIEDGKVLDAIYVGAFEGYINDEKKLSSIGGVIPSNNVYAADFLAAAKENGVRYTLYDNRSVDALWTLVAVEYGCRNTNRVFGYGVADYMQPVKSDYLSIQKDATNTNIATAKYNSSEWYVRRYMPVGSTITICRSEQGNILTQRKITAVIDKPEEGVTEFHFDGEPLDLVAETDFIGSAPIFTNYVEDVPSGGMTTWHTGRANWITTDADLMITQNPVRYRWIENPVGNLWHFLPDVTFKNGEMYICNNMRDYEMFNADGTTYVSTGLTFESNYPNNGSKNDKTGPENMAATPPSLPNLWITSLIDDSGHVFGDKYSIELTSKQAFGAYYYVNDKSPSIIANGGGFDHQWRCNMLTNRGWIDASNKWYLYGSRLLYKQIQE